MNVVTVTDAWNVCSKHYDFVNSHYWKSEVLKNHCWKTKYTFLVNIINAENIIIYFTDYTAIL